MKVYCVFQASGSYEMYYNELVEIFSTKELAEEKKKELDKKVVTSDNLWSVVPEKIYNDWSFHCEDEENDIWSPDDCYKGYTISQFLEQQTMCENYNTEYSPATIEEYEVI